MCKKIRDFFIQRKKKLITTFIMVLVILSIVGFVFNIVYSIKYDGEWSNLFTVISGWVSGIATVCLGLITVLQAAKFKKISDISNQKQEIVLNEMKQTLENQVAYAYKQTLIAEIVQQRSTYENQKDKIEHVWGSDLNSSLVDVQLTLLSEKGAGIIKAKSLVNKLMQVIESFAHTLEYDFFYFDKKKEMYQACIDILNYLKDNEVSILDSQKVFLGKSIELGKNFKMLYLEFLGNIKFTIMELIELENISKVKEKFEILRNCNVNWLLEINI